MLDIQTSSPFMDIFIDFDGAGFGQRGKFQVYADDIGNTTSHYEGEDYIIDSEGIGFFSLQVDRLPIMEAFTLSSLTLLGSDVEHIRISVDMEFGIYPLIRLEEARGGSVQFKVSGELTIGDSKVEPELFFITLRTKDILGLSIISGVSINKDTSALDMGRSDGAFVVPAPILTVWYHTFKQLIGGGGDVLAR